MTLDELKLIFDWLREQFEEKSVQGFDGNGNPVNVRFVASIMAEDIITEAEVKFGCHAICYLDSPCEYQNEDIRVVDSGISCELLDRLVEPSKRCSHGLCEFRTHEECVSFEYCENCFVDAMKDVIKNSDSRFRKIMEVE